MIIVSIATCGTLFVEVCLYPLSGGQRGFKLHFPSAIVCLLTIIMTAVVTAYYAKLPAPFRSCAPIETEHARPVTFRRAWLYNTIIPDSARTVQSRVIREILRRWS